MLKKILTIIIFLLIISTTFIKNHTKKLDEKIFIIKENINYLKSIKQLVQLENDYLRAPEKLLELNKLYFDEELKYTPRDSIKIINNTDQLNLDNINLK
tara:strand:- start:127 stop:423 length:297 start_codon:yes stop_codon:yes gene_type:complete